MSTSKKRKPAPRSDSGVVETKSLSGKVLSRTVTDEGVSPDYVLQVPSRTLAKRSKWLRWAFPPLGMVYSSTVLKRRDRDGEVQDPATRKSARVSFWVSSAMLVVYLCVLAFVAGTLSDKYYEKKIADARAAHAVQVASEMDRAVEGSPSYGLVSEEYCGLVEGVADASPERRMYVSSPDEATEAVLASYDAFSGVEGPNSEFYTSYAAQLRSFEDTAQDMLEETAVQAREAGFADMWACLPVVEARDGIDRAKSIEEFGW